MARKKQNLEKYKVVHVIQRTELKTPWFKDQNICEKRIYLFKRACIEEGITILAFSVLPTHTHDILVFE